MDKKYKGSCNTTKLGPYRWAFQEVPMRRDESYLWSKEEFWTGERYAVDTELEEFEE